VGFGKIGVQVDGAAIGGGGVLDPSQRQERGPEIVMTFSEIRLEADGDGIGLESFVQASQGLQRVAKTAAIERDVGFDLDGPADRFDCNSVLPDLMGQKTQQMQSIRLSGIDFQHLDVDRFRLCQLAGSLMSQTGFQNAAHTR
jgi:hypothetical protein